MQLQLGGLKERLDVAMSLMLEKKRILETLSFSHNLDEYTKSMEYYTGERYAISNLRYDAELKEHRLQFDDMCNVLGECGLI